MILEHKNEPIVFLQQKLLVLSSAFIDKFKEFFLHWLNPAKKLVGHQNYCLPFVWKIGDKNPEYFGGEMTAHLNCFNPLNDPSCSS